MYLLIQCPGCHTVTYVDPFQRWKLCHVCGESIDVRRAPVYLEVGDYVEAENIIKQLESFMEKTGKKKLSPGELKKLRTSYASWVKQST